LEGRLGRRRETLITSLFGAPEHVGNRADLDMIKQR
jgi:hypothetical protein